jgi:hypothetical protein
MIEIAGKIILWDMATVISNFFKIGVNYLNVSNSSEFDYHMSSLEKAQKHIGLKKTLVLINP